MACYIFGAGDVTLLHQRPQESDYVIAADGGWLACQDALVVPDLLIGDFDSLHGRPDFHNVMQFPVEKNDTDMMLAIKHGLELGHREFHLYGGLGGRRTDHTIANLQALVYLARHGATGWLYGDGEVYTAIHNGALTLPAKERGILSVFCFGAEARGVAICGAQYEVEDVVLTADFPLGVSNHFIGKQVRISVDDGNLLLGLLDE